MRVGALVLGHPEALDRKQYITKNKRGMALYVRQYVTLASVHK